MQHSKVFPLAPHRLALGTVGRDQLMSSHGLPKLTWDGASTADTPAAEAESRGATTIYLLLTYQGGPLVPRPRSVSAVGSRAIGPLFGSSGTDEIVAAHKATVPLLPTPPTSAVSPSDIARSPRLIDRAERLPTPTLQEAPTTQLSLERCAAATVSGRRSAESPPGPTSKKLTQLAIYLAEMS